MDWVLLIGGGGLLAWIEWRYRRGRYGPLQEVGSVVSICLLAVGAEAIARHIGL